MSLISDEVLPHVLRAYASCRTFHCSAQLTRRIASDSVTESHFKMKLAYASPRQLFLQWWLDDTKSSKHHTLIATDEIVIRHSWFEAVWQREATIGDALASYTGISSGLALHIPSLLIDYDGYSLFERVEKQTKQAGELYVLSGVARGDIERTVTVRAFDMAIVGMQERYSIPSGMVECESEYHDVQMTHHEEDMK